MGTQPSPRNGTDTNGTEATLVAETPSADTGPTPDAELLPPGMRIGRYLIVELIGEGGMGSVVAVGHNNIGNVLQGLERFDEAREHKL